MALKYRTNSEKNKEQNKMSLCTFKMDSPQTTIISRSRTQDIKRKKKNEYNGTNTVLKIHRVINIYDGICFERNHHQIV
jgi:hypothetical protein